MKEQEHITKIRKTYEARIKAFRNEILQDALTMLDEDLRNPKLSKIPGVPQDDIFMMRANQVAFAFFNSDLITASERMLRGLIEETKIYDKKYGTRHHLGTLYVNTAMTCIAQGNFDHGIVEILTAAQDDEETRDISNRDILVVADILEKVFDPTWKEILAIVQNIDSRLTLASIKDLIIILGNVREYAFLTYIRQTLTHIKINQDTPNEFSRMQIFSALRNLSCLLEVEFKILAGNMQKTLFPAMELLFKEKTWWKTFNTTREKIGATQKSTQSVDEQLKDAIALSAANSGINFWRSLLVAYIVRNYTTHQMETCCDLVQVYPQQTLAHIVYTMIAAPTRTNQKHRQANKSLQANCQARFSTNRIEPAKAHSGGVTSPTLPIA